MLSCASTHRVSLRMASQPLLCSELGRQRSWQTRRVCCRAASESRAGKAIYCSNGRNTYISHIHHNTLLASIEFPWCQVSVKENRLQLHGQQECGAKAQEGRAGWGLGWFLFWFFWGVWVFFFSLPRGGGDTFKSKNWNSVQQKLDFLQDGVVSWLCCIHPPQG